MRGSTTSRGVVGIDSIAPTGDIDSWQVRLRRAAFGAINEADVAAIVQKQVELAKSGNAAALRFVTDVLIGGLLPPAPHKLEITSDGDVELAARIKSATKVKASGRAIESRDDVDDDDEAEPSAAAIERRLRQEADRKFSGAVDDD